MPEESQGRLMRQGSGGGRAISAVKHENEEEVMLPYGVNMMGVGVRTTWNITRDDFYSCAGYPCTLVSGDFEDGMVKVVVDVRDGLPASFQRTCYDQLP